MNKSSHHAILCWAPILLLFAGGCWNPHKQWVTDAFALRADSNVQKVIQDLGCPDLIVPVGDAIDRMSRGSFEIYGRKVDNFFEYTKAYYHGELWKKDMLAPESRKDIALVYLTKNHLREPAAGSQSMLFIFHIDQSRVVGRYHAFYVPGCFRE